MLNSEFIKDKFFDKYIYKVEFAEMLRIVPGNLQECYLFFCRNITYYSAQKKFFAKMLHIPNAIHRHRHGHIRFVQTGIFFTE